jgi:glycogenin glucosyltransferase
MTDSYLPGKCTPDYTHNYITLSPANISLGALVLAHSLRDAGTKKKLAVLVTLDTLSADTHRQLRTVYDYIIPVERIRNTNLANLYLMGRPDLASAFTKIALWKQTMFRKIVYLDADVVALRALDELFDVEASFAAAPDIGWPDAFNSGVMVLTPDMGEYWSLQTMATAGESFDGADQGLLNQYFEHRPWQRLKFTYNCTPNAEYQWEPAYRYYKRDISAVHFIGKNKPWSGSRSGGTGVYGTLLARWWAVYDRHMRQGTGQQQIQIGAQSTESGQSHLLSSVPAPTSGVEPEAPITTTEPFLTDPGEMADNIDERVIVTTPFSAPEMAWDATRFEPPAQSAPEAANFPSTQYTFSSNNDLFKPPRAYPEPPKDMWYKVPESRHKAAQMPAPIFPWERETDRPQPTRVFADDLPPAPASPTHPFSTVHYNINHRVAPEKSSEQVCTAL